jgi:hypothetical protein
MKTLALFLITFLTCVMTPLAHAESEYVSLNVTSGYIAERVIDDWEKRNHTKRIVSVAMHQKDATILGLLITYTSKSDKEVAEIERAERDKKIANALTFQRFEALEDQRWSKTPITEQSEYLGCNGSEKFLLRKGGEVLTTRGYHQIERVGKGGFIARIGAATILLDKDGKEMPLQALK